VIVEVLECSGAGDRENDASRENEGLSLLKSVALRSKPLQSLVSRVTVDASRPLIQDFKTVDLGLDCLALAPGVLLDALTGAHLFAHNHDVRRKSGAAGWTGESYYRPVLPPRRYISQKPISDQSHFDFFNFALFVSHYGSSLCSRNAKRQT
jgi:hypothetical protein